MSINAHGHRAWGKNSHVSEKVVTTRTHIVCSSYTIHVAVMRRDSVVARKIFRCLLTVSAKSRVCQALPAERHNSSALDLVETPPFVFSAPGDQARGGPSPHSV